jgi:peptidoglycan/xylan/chitin deacetylase (PgdA/CDA1 family)
MRNFLLAALSLGAALGAAPSSARDIAFTFDDLPTHSALPPGVTRLQVAQDVIAALKGAGVPSVYGFINGVGLEREPGTDAVLKAWRAAGFPLGNHGWAHLGLSKIDETTFESELTRNEPILQGLAGGTDWHWFRFPFLDEASADPAKRAASRAWLAKHGYRVAAVTASFADYAFNEPYARCVAKGDQAAIKEMEQAYLDAAAESIRLSEQAEKAQFGHTPPDILLMHIGAFDAHMLPRLLALYKDAGFRFVPLDQAALDLDNIGLVDPRLPPLPGRTLSDPKIDAIVAHIGTLCT